MFQTTYCCICCAQYICKIVIVRCKIFFIYLSFTLSTNPTTLDLYDLFSELPVRFVSGLLVPQTRFILDGLFRKGSSKCPSPSSSLSPPPSLPPLPPFLLPLLHSQLQSGRLSPERQVNVCHCLYEAQDPGLAQRLQGWLRILAQEQVSDQSGPAKRDWSELAFLLQLIPDLQELHLESQGLDAEGLRRLLPVLPLFSTLRWATTH